MSRVHVFGYPEERALAYDERLCTDEDADAGFVIFHGGAVQVTGGEWMCVACEMMSEVRDHETGIDPKRYDRERGHIG